MKSQASALIGRAAFCSRLLVALALATVASGCAKDESDERARIGVRVERLTQQKSLRITWTTTVPVRALAFARAGIFRSGKWKPLAFGTKVEIRGAREILFSDEPRKEFTYLVPDAPAEVPSDYPFLSRFTTGGLVLYTGHLQTVPIRCTGACDEKQVESQMSVASTTALSFDPSSGENIVVAGASTTARTSFEDGTVGRFVFLGSDRVVERSGVSVVMDSALPGWIQLEIETRLPEILDHNSRRLGKGLSHKPVVFVSYQRDPVTTNASFSGAVVAGEMLVSLNGRRWAQKQNEEQETLLKLLAHESFHFWNASLFNSIDRPGGRWLHEGSADAFAYLTLFELGLIDAKRFVSLQTEALNRCMVGLTASDLPNSNRPGVSRNHYECGAVIQFLLQSSLQKKGVDLWGFWTSLFNAAPSGFYTHDLFFDLASKTTGSPELVQNIMELTGGKVSGQAREARAIDVFFRDAFGAVGMNLANSDFAWPTWYHRVVGERAISSSVEADCGGNGFVTTEETGARLNGSPLCQNLKSRVEIDRVGEFALWEEGVQAYDFIQRTCFGAGSISFSRSNERRSNFILTCPQLPSRPAFLRWTQSAPTASNELEP